MDSFDFLFDALKILAVMVIALPLICYVVLRRFAAFRKLDGFPGWLIAMAIVWVTAALLMRGANGLTDWVGQAGLRANCGVVPAPWLGVSKPIIAPLPRFLLSMNGKDEAAIVNALTTVEPRWPALDIDSPELDLSLHFKTSMGKSESGESSTSSPPLERSSLVLLRHQQIDPKFWYGVFEHEYTLEHGYGIKKLATQRVPFGVRVLWAQYRCVSDDAAPPGTNDAIVRMIRAVLRPEPQK